MYPTPNKHFVRYSQKGLLKQLLATTVVMTLLGGILPIEAADSTGSATTRDNGIQIRGGIMVGARGEEIIPSLSLRDASIKDVLYSLADQAGFNIIVDQSVNGTISLDLKDISINKIMEYILTLANLTYYKDGNTFIITDTDDADKKSLNRLVLKSIPVKYSNAKDLAGVLNGTIFNIHRPGGNTKAVATADPRTNSILIMGNEQDINLAKRALAELDFPLQHKTFFLKNASPTEVANTIAQTLFSVSLTQIGAGGGTASGSGVAGGPSGNTAGGGLGVAGSSGTSTASAGSSSGGNNSSGSRSASGSSGGTGGGRGLGNVKVLKGGPVTFIANEANNTLTLIATAEQIELAEAMLYDVDIKAPQVAIQVTVLELSEQRTKSYTPSVNSNLPGVGSIQGRYGGLNFGPNGATFFWDKDGRVSSLPGATLEMLGKFAIHADIEHTKAKVLANPTLLAVSGTTSTLNVTQDIFGGEQVTTQATTGLTASTPIIKQVGITLNITPEVSNNGTVTLQLSPTISSQSGSQPTRNGLIALTASNTLNVAKARIQDGETLILGGLIREDVNTLNKKVPFLGELPLIGGMFRSLNNTNNARRELVILVTPHIVKEDGVPYFRKEWRNNLSYEELSQSQPQHAAAPPNTIIPAANPGPATNGIYPMQTLEQRPEDKANPTTINTGRASNLPLATFSEVLK